MRIIHAGTELISMATEVLSGALADALDAKPRVSFAVSGGSTPWPIFRSLARASIDWQRVDVYQVDERVAPDGDPARNLTGLREALLDRVPAIVHPMPVNEANLDTAAARYAADLPEVLDLVHLGLGEDGHTASLVPGDPVLGITNRAVALTAPYRGLRRMTLTFPVLDRAASIAWIVAGTEKAVMVRRLIDADPRIPAGRVTQERAVLLTDLLAG
jgi:6-phosphogluconolactonase